MLTVIQGPGSSVVPYLPRPPVGLHLIRPPAGAPAWLAEAPQRSVRCRRPRPVPYVMPVIRGVLVAVAPFPASLGAGHLGAAQRGCLLAGLAECYGKLIVCHLRDPLRCRLAVCAAWRGWCAGRRGGGPGSGVQSRVQSTSRQIGRSRGEARVTGA